MRIGKEQLDRLASDFEHEPAFAALLSFDVITAAVLDLRDAHARIKELETLSASQEQALGMMERGAL